MAPFHSKTNRISEGEGVSAGCAEQYSQTLTIFLKHLIIYRRSYLNIYEHYIRIYIAGEN